MIGAGESSAKSGGLPTAGTRKRLERTSCFIPWPGEFLSSDYPPASKRRMLAIILAKHDRKPLCCGQ
jgi:hypothetical protein